FDIEIKDKKGEENLVADHLSRLENPDLRVFTEEETADEFLNEHLMMLKAKPNDDEPCEILEVLGHYHSRPTEDITVPRLLEEREDTNQSSLPQIAPLEASQMVSSVKLPILKKGGYILWTMKMEQYLAHTDYAIWDVILNDEHLVRFHGIKDAKTLWVAIKTRFGGNVESKKMQKNVLKQHFVTFSVSNLEGLEKGYDRFQRLRSVLEIHEADVSTEDENKKFLRSLPSAWSNISLIMRNKPDIDNLDIYDLTTKNPGNIGRDAGNAGYRGRDNGKRPPKEEYEKASVVQDGLGTCDWSYQLEEEAIDFALNAFTSNPLSSSSSNYEEEVTKTVFDNRSSNKENSLANDRFKKGKGFHAVPPHLTGNYMPPKPDLLIEYRLNTQKYFQRKR
nr:hypothetical protein [Tanacetum cinerariifolium]